MQHETIYVQIASYRDLELIKTIESCLTMAAFPERLRFGIVNQYDVETKDILVPYATDLRFRIHQMPWQNAQGAGLARYLCNTMYKGETFTLQIDSHMRFKSNWDQDLIAEWSSCNDDQAVLSGHPYDFSYGSDGKEILSSHTYASSIPVVFSFHNHVTPILKSVPIQNYSEDDNVRLGYFVVGGFVFGPGGICTQAIYEKDVSFMGEEVVYSLKLFTSGYTVYKPRKLGIFHLYQRPQHPRFWNDMTEGEKSKQAATYHDITQRSIELVNKILEGKVPDRLGTKRTIADFERYVGIDFTKRLIHPDMQKGVIPPVVKEDNWIDIFFPETTQTHNIDISLLLERYSDFVSLYFRLYDKYNVLAWQGSVPVSDLLGKNEYTIYYIGRMPAKTSTVHIFVKNDTWKDVTDLFTPKHEHDTMVQNEG